MSLKHGQASGMEEYGTDASLDCSSTRIITDGTSQIVYCFLSDSGPSVSPSHSVEMTVGYTVLLVYMAVIKISKLRLDPPKRGYIRLPRGQ